MHKTNGWTRTHSRIHALTQLHAQAVDTHPLTDMRARASVLTYTRALAATRAYRRPDWRYVGATALRRVCHPICQLQADALSGTVHARMAVSMHVVCTITCTLYDGAYAVYVV